VNEARGSYMLARAQLHIGADEIVRAGVVCVIA
jgi:hypothetical protein